MTGFLRQQDYRELSDLSCLLYTVVSESEDGNTRMFYLGAVVGFALPTNKPNILVCLELVRNVKHIALSQCV